MRFFISCLLLFILAAPVFPVYAESVVRSGETVSIAADQVVAGDLYTIASVVNVSGTVVEDLVVAGGKVTLNGVVEHDVLMVTGSADLHGRVNEDVRIIAGETIIAEPVAGDVLVLSGRLEVLSTATIGGDLLLFGGEAVVAGAVDGKIIGYASTLRLDAPVGGDVTVSTEQLTLGDRAEVAGDIRYTSNNLVVRSQNAVVSGELLRNDPVVSSPRSNLEGSLLPMLALLFTALLWYLVSRKSQLAVVSYAAAHLPRSLLIGLLVILGTPLMAIILMVSMIGLHVGLVVLLLYVLILLLGAVVAIGLLGQLLLVLFGLGQKPFSLLTLLVGTLASWVFVLVPLAGPLLSFGFFLMGVGALADYTLKQLRS